MLRSIKSLRDFWIHATDGDLGAVSDFYVAVNGDWKVPALVMDTGNWLPGKRVVLPTAAVTQADWENRYLHVDRTRQQIRELPSAEIEPVDMHAIREIEKLKVCANDGPIGGVQDLLCDDERWAVRYLILDLPEMPAGRFVAVALKWIQEIDWPGAGLRLNSHLDVLRSSPPFDSPIDDDFERRLAAHYEQPAPR